MILTRLHQCALILLAATGNALAQDRPAPELLAHQPLRLALHALATEHPTRIQLLSVGTSRAGRQIDALRFTGSEPVGPKPALLVVANLEGPQVYTSALALDLARRFAADEGELPTLLANTTVYIIPRANPDGAQARFEKPLMERLATGAGVDNDRDGRSGEDSPSDVNGDGLLSQMRVLDPAGTWIEDPLDPRAMTLADTQRGELGRYKLLVEGRDSDGDGEVGEDPLLDARMDQNFPQEWPEHTPSAGLFPTDEPEARALAEFVLHHRDIGLVLVIGAQDNLAEAPSTVSEGAAKGKRIPPPGMLETDAKLLASLARQLEEAGVEAKPGDKSRAGTFQSWCEAQRGLPTVSLQLWETPSAEQEAKTEDSNDAQKTPDEEQEQPTTEEASAAPSKKDKPDRKPSETVKALAWIDRSGEASRFVPWTSFDHPELGPLEIGGLAPYALVEPPLEELPGLAVQLSQALPILAAALPRATISSFTARDLGNQLFELKAAVSNNALLPLRSAAALRARTPRPLRLHLTLPAGASVLAGEPIQSVDNLTGSGGREELRWLVRCTDPTTITLRAQADHVGQTSAQPELIQ